METIKIQYLNDEIERLRYIDRLFVEQAVRFCVCFHD